MDLPLPPTAPSLGGYGEYVWDHASFALYSLTTQNSADLGVLASQLEREWWDGQGQEGSHLVRVAPSHIFHQASLKEVLEAHTRLLRKAAEETGSDSGEKEMPWFPTAFLVLTENDTKTDRLLFVYADDEEDGCPLDKFEFWIKDAHLMLSSLAYGDETCAESKGIYGVAR